MFSFVSFACVVQDGSNQVSDVVVGERIVDMRALAPSPDEEIAAEQPKLLRDGRHAGLAGFGELAHAPLAVAKALEDLQPWDVAGRAKNRRSAFERLVRDGSARPRSRGVGPVGMIH